MPSTTVTLRPLPREDQGHRRWPALTVPCEFLRLEGESVGSRRGGACRIEATKPPFASAITVTPADATMLVGVNRQRIARRVFATARTPGVLTER